MKRFLRFFLAVGILCLLGLVPRTALAESSTEEATFALVIGSNISVDNLPPLKYADDDAARYQDLFRLLGARTYLLTRLDDNTRRLHPQAVAEAAEPKKASLDTALAQLASDVTTAKARGVETVVYFVYAGHGNVENGQGYITLEDARLTGNDLAGMFAKIPATKIHVIADACASFYLAYSRGPGGERRALPEGFGLAAGLSADPRVGLLLSTSSARESHEWDAFQAGVFSHEVRSGLYGAADADGDGKVSYREIAAFVSRANASIPNDRYRPEIHAKPPGVKGGDTLLDLRQAGRRLNVDGKHAGHYYLEDARGVRLADFHNGANQRVSLLRPPPRGHAYLHRVDDEKEFRVDGGPTVLEIADLKQNDARIASRGAAHEAFNELFALAFDEQAVSDYKDCEPAPPPPPEPVIVDEKKPLTTKSKVGLALVGVGAAAVVVGAGLSVTNAVVYESESSASREKKIELNDGMDFRRTTSIVLYSVGGALAIAGVATLLWPASKGVVATADAHGAFVGYGGSL